MRTSCRRLTGGSSLLCAAVKDRADPSLRTYVRAWIRGKESGRGKAERARAGYVNWITVRRSRGRGECGGEGPQIGFGQFVRSPIYGSPTWNRFRQSVADTLLEIHPATLRVRGQVPPRFCF
ncbi:unnamed protein product, partial [Iphiclides podalirius]